MFRIFAILALTLLGLVSTPVPTPAQWGPWANPRWTDTSLQGTYVLDPWGGTCYVLARRGGYVFVNEKGERALFAPVGPAQFRNVAGQWQPGIVATVSGDRFGRMVIRFDSPFGPPTFWVQATW